MRRRKGHEGEQSKRLVELGFGQDIPQDGFSDQPDSGGSIGGLRGVQEYGIEGGVSREQESEEVGDSPESRLICMVAVD